MVYMNPSLSFTFALCLDKLRPIILLFTLSYSPSLSSSALRLSLFFFLLFLLFSFFLPSSYKDSYTAESIDPTKPVFSVSSFDFIAFLISSISAVYLFNGTDAIFVFQSYQSAFSTVTVPDAPKLFVSPRVYNSFSTYRRTMVWKNLILLIGADLRSLILFSVEIQMSDMPPTSFEMHWQSIRLQRLTLVFMKEEMMS